MENYLDDETSYFKNVVKDAVDDLKHNRQAYVFCKEHIEAVEQLIKKKILVKEIDGIFYLTIDRNCDNI